jgi:peptidoglycan/xylan/chitin deacetylase (PgdA/CDA1 family)
MGMLSSMLTSGFSVQLSQKINTSWAKLFYKEQLTVVCYHRVSSTSNESFKGFKPTISATTENFIRHVEYLQANYNLISLSSLVSWIDNNCPLPPRPALVTFDDGYRDNGVVAWPILRKRGVPLVIFLATDYIGASKPFMWDFAAYCFEKTSRSYAKVPLIGEVSLATERERDAACVAWVETLKRLQAPMRSDAMKELSCALSVSPDSDTFRHLYLDWFDVKTLAKQGVEFGAHTCTHPILTKLPLSEAADEIVGSINSVATGLGSKPLAFAYPNGMIEDYSKHHEEMVGQSGLSVAFSLKPGPIEVSRVREERMAIPRVYIGGNDTLPRFIAKLNGAARLAHSVRLLRSRYGGRSH